MIMMASKTEVFWEHFLSSTVMKDEIQFLIAIAAIKKKSLCHFIFYMPQESIVDCQEHFVMFQIWQITILLCNWKIISLWKIVNTKLA